MDYVMRYEFDREGRLETLFEYSDSKLRSGILRRWVERKEKEKEERELSGRTPGQHDRFYSIIFLRLFVSCNNVEAGKVSPYEGFEGGQYHFLAHLCLPTDSIEAHSFS